MSTGTQELTEAQVTAWLEAKTRELLTRYPQCTEACIGMSVHVGKDSHFTCHQVHLIGAGWRECGMGVEKDLAQCEQEAAASIETRAKILAKAREAAAKAARDLTTLEAILGG